MSDVEENHPFADLRCLPSLCRGMYNRVAQKVGCDPSYVSRVARGERNSKAVSDALQAEMQLTWTKASEGFGEAADKRAKRKGRAAASSAASAASA